MPCTGGYSYEHILLFFFKRMLVQFLAPVAGSLYLSVTPEGSDAFALHGQLHSCTQTHIQTHTNTPYFLRLKKKTFKLCMPV